MKKIFTISTLLILIITKISYAAPSISTVDGTLSSKNIVSIRGSGFGTNLLKVEWLGDHIESGTGSFSKTRWTTSSAAVPVHNESSYHSGKKSLYLSYDTAKYGTGSNYYIYNNGSHIDSAYITFWLKWQKRSGDGQWKWFRLRNDGNVGDTYPEFYMNLWSANSGARYFFNRAGGSDYGEEFDSVDNGSDCGSGPVYCGYRDRAWNFYQYPDGMPLSGEGWVRVEIFAKASTPGKKDGSILYHISRPGKGIQKALNYDNNLMTISSNESDRWQYVVLGHWIGNGLTKIDVWHDDVFIQTGSKARVELGDKSTWNSCTFREIQVPKSWQNDSVSFSTNVGSFSSGQKAYLYVVDSSGSVNAQGYPITVGSGTTGTSPPLSAPSTPADIRIAQ